MMQHAWPVSLRCFLFGALILGLSACSAFKPQVEPFGASGALPPRKIELPRVNYLGVPCYLHAVRWPEESLEVIARWYTGNSRNARILERVTPNLRAHDLRSGDTVFIPLEVSRRSDPMPRRFARRHGKTATPPAVNRPHPAASPPEEFPEGETPPSPYGPRTFPE